MRLAQRLYEGIEIGGETVGLITYMRTDGIDMAAEAITAIRKRKALSNDVRALKLNNPKIILRLFLNRVMQITPSLNLIHSSVHTNDYYIRREDRTKYIYQRQFELNDFRDRLTQQFVRM